MPTCRWPCRRRLALQELEKLKAEVWDLMREAEKARASYEMLLKVIREKNAQIEKAEQDD